MIFWLPVFFMIAVWLWPALWFRLVQNRLDVELTVERTQVHYGDKIPLTVRFRNRSWLPCPHVEVVIALPNGLSAQREKQERVLRWKTYVLMRQELTVELHCFATKRGLQQLGQHELVIQLNEGFGLRQLFVRKPMDQQVVVLPERRPLIQARPMLDALVGNLEVQRWLHPDEAMLRGIRPFQTGDSHRHIAWFATARTGEWMTKEFSTTTDMEIALIFNAQFEDNPWMGTDVEVFDQMCSITSAVAQSMGRERIRLVFGSNATSPQQPNARWYSEQAAHGIEVLLGRFHPMANGDFSTVLTSIPLQLSPHAPLVVVAHYFTADQYRLLRKERKRGRGVTVVWTGGDKGRSELHSLGIRVLEVPLSITKGEEVRDARAAE